MLATHQAPGGWCQVAVRPAESVGSRRLGILKQPCLSSTFQVAVISLPKTVRRRCKPGVLSGNTMHHCRCDVLLRAQQHQLPKRHSKIYLRVPTQLLAARQMLMLSTARTVRTHSRQSRRLMDMRWELAGDR